MRTTDQPLTYARYLGLEAVLTAGQPVSETLAEAHFIAAHQAIEIRFRVIIASVRQAIRKVCAGPMADAVRPLQRGTALLHAVLFEMETLHQCLSPTEFAAFREALGTASGLQSAQFRELELLTGMSTDEAYIRRLRALYGGDLPSALARTATEPTLQDAHRVAAHTVDHDHQAEQVADLISHIDTLLMRWRAEHLVMVRHKLGDDATGTGGRTTDYLATTLSPAVPDAWGPRTDAPPPTRPSREPFMHLILRRLRRSLAPSRTRGAAA